MSFTDSIHKSIPYIKKGTFFSIVIVKIQSKLKSLIKSAIGFEWQHYYVLSLSCDSLDDFSFEKASDANIKIATEEDWIDPTLIPELSVEKINYIIERCRNSDYCCVIYKQDHVQCYGFIAFRAMELTPNAKFQLPDYEAFMYDDYCFLASRRKGLYKKVLNERSRIIKSLGYKRITTIVTPANKPSWNGHKDWKRDQSFYWYKFRGKEHCTLKTYKPVDKQ